MSKPRMFAHKYSKALARLIGRPLRRADGLPARFLAAAERKLKVRMPPALREYYLIAGRLALNREHNRLYSPGKLRMLRGKLLFMEAMAAYAKEAALAPDPSMAYFNLCVTQYNLKNVEGT